MHPPADPAASLAALREAGADGFDPVRFHFLETLSRRAQAHEGDVRRVLDIRLQAALTEYRQCIEQAKHPADTPPTPSARQAGLDALTDLNRHIAESTRQASDQRDTGSGDTHTELKSIRAFRDTWSRISTDKQLRQAMESGPDNAGPLNSHLLVLRSLALMRDVAPAYLDRFMDYMDALMWLDQATGSKKLMPKSTGNIEGNKKRQAGRER